jgi:hypothetical protein
MSYDTLKIIFYHVSSYLYLENRLKLAISQSQRCVTNDPASLM